MDEHGDDGQEWDDEGEDVVHEPKVRGNGKADDELGHLQVAEEDLPKIGSRALHTLVKNLSYPAHELYM